MYKKTLLSMAVASTLTLTGCLDDGGPGGSNANPEYKITNPYSDGKTSPLFNPVTSELPVPNDILFAGQSPVDGTMTIGDPESRAANPVFNGIDFMDGNSVIGAFDIKFDGSLDPNQTLDAANFIQLEPGNAATTVPNPNQNVFLLPLTYPSGDGLSNTGEIPTFAEGLQFQTALALAGAGDVANAVAILNKLATPVARAEILSLDGGTNNVLRLNPLSPLDAETKYLVILINSITDANGDPTTPSTTYESLSNPDIPLGSASLVPVEAAVGGWEQLAAGYFGFMQTVYDGAGAPFTAPSADDITMTISFTTGGTDSVLKSIAAPATFFDKSLTTGFKQDSIGKLVDGTYTLQAANIDPTLPVADQQINGLTIQLLTVPVFPGPLPPAGPNPLYNADIEGAITAGADYPQIAESATAAFIMQTAAAEAAVAINNTDGVTIAQQAAGTAAALDTLLPRPKARTTNFYQKNCVGPAEAPNSCALSADPADIANGSNISGALTTGPGFVYQGEITLPYYQLEPTDSSGANIKNGTWQADATIGGAIDPTGATPPSSKTTYRYPFPTQQGEQTVPLLAVTPNGNFSPKPSGGWPVIIYQHGITTDRSAILPMANALAAGCLAGAPECFATIAIDQPLHGVVPSGSTFPSFLNSVSDPNNPVVGTGNIGTNKASADLGERHFNYTADAQLNPVPMNYTPGLPADESGESGSLFINLSYFANSRDNLRQMPVDLMNLNASIATMDVDGDGNPDFDPTRVYFMGHSLGGIDGIPYLATVNNAEVQYDMTTSILGNPELKMITAASLLNTGGGVPKLLENSPNTTFGAAAILPGLDAVSDGVLVQGSSSLEIYFSVLQGVLDSGDSMNFASSLSDENTGILLTEIVGNGADIPSDDTIPNAADTRWGEDNGPLNETTDAGFQISSLPAPLAGTEPLIYQFGAEPTATATTGNKLVAITRFTEGLHGTPVSAGQVEGDSAAVFDEMVSETVQFFATGGTAIPAINESIINSDPVDPVDE